MATSEGDAKGLGSNGVNSGGQKHCCSDPHCKDGDNKNGQKMPTIFDAIKSGLFVPVQTFVEVQGVEVLRSRDENGHTPAHWACLGGHATLLRYIIERGGPVDEVSDHELGQRPIHWACCNGHIAIVDILLRAGVNIDVVDNKGCTPLIVACQYGKTMLAGYLMGKGGRLQMVDKEGDNALHWAAFKGQSELMRLLIYSGFNPHQRDNFGQTPLHLACISGSLQATKELCEQDHVEIDIADKNGKTPLMLAAGRKHDTIVGYLKKEAKFNSGFLPRLDLQTIFFGPPGNSKGPILFFVFNVLFWGYPMYIFKCLPTTWYELQPLHIIFMTLNVFMWICLYHCNTKDPGFLPQHTEEYDRAIKEVAHFDEWKQGPNPLSRLCHTCRTVKPMRAKHCRVCNRCVLMFDHHCPYIYNCVGYNNRVTFYLFSCSMMLIGTIVLYLAFYVWSLEGWPLVWHYILGLMVILFFHMIASFVALSASYEMLINLTTNERLNYKRYAYLKDGKGKFYNPYNRGWKTNILEFFYLRRGLSEEEVQFMNVQIV